jgi:dynein heavy chain
VKKIGAMSFKTEVLQAGLKDKVKDWKTQYSKSLHNKAKTELYELTDKIKNLSQRLNKEVVDIKSLGMVMMTVEEIRKEEAEVDLNFEPVLDMYNLLDNYLPNLITEKEEMDNRQFLRKKQSDLLLNAQSVEREL